MADKKINKRVKSKRHLARQQREAKQTRLIIIITVIIGVIIIGLLGYGAVDQFIVRPRQPVAQVGDTVITVREFESQVQYTRIQMLNQTYQYYNFYQQFGQFGESFLQTAQTIASQLSQPVTLGRDILDEMIDNIIIQEEAAQRGISASEEEVDEAIQQAFGFFPDGTPTPTTTATIESTPTYSATQLALVTLTSTPTATSLPTDTPEVTPTPLEDEAADDAELAPEETGSTEAPTEESADQEVESTPTPEVTSTITLTPTPYTTQVFGEELEEFNELYSTYNFDLTDLREIFRTEILREKLLEDITEDLVPVKEEVWARHILVETEEEALEIIGLLEEGADFHELAAERSIDDSNSAQGGDLGWFDDDTMVPEFTETAFDLEVGEISEPVETSFGFHIIQSLGKRESQIPPQEFAQEKESAFTAWLSEKRNARTDIIIYDEWEDFVPTDPQIPQQLLVELFQQQQPDAVPPVTP